MDVGEGEYGKLGHDSVGDNDPNFRRDGALRMLRPKQVATCIATSAPRAQAGAHPGGDASGKLYAWGLAEMGALGIGEDYSEWGEGHRGT